MPWQLSSHRLPWEFLFTPSQYGPSITSSWSIFTSNTARQWPWILFGSLCFIVSVWFWYTLFSHIDADTSIEVKMVSISTTYDGGGSNIAELQVYLCILFVHVWHLIDCGKIHPTDCGGELTRWVQQNGNKVWMPISCFFIFLTHFLIQIWDSFPVLLVSAG